jgi:hypothetical protein
MVGDSDECSDLGSSGRVSTIVNLLHFVLKYLLLVSTNSHRFNIKYALIDKALDEGCSIEVYFYFDFKGNFCYVIPNEISKNA